MHENTEFLCGQAGGYGFIRWPGIYLLPGVQMRKHSSEENSLYIGMQELIRKAIDAGEFRSDVSAKEINDYLFVVFRGVLYEWCLCPADQVFSLEERLEQPDWLQH